MYMMTKMISIIIIIPIFVIFVIIIIIIIKSAVTKWKQYICDLISTKRLFHVVTLETSSFSNTRPSILIGERQKTIWTMARLPKRRKRAFF